MLSQKVAGRLGIPQRTVDMILVETFSEITRNLCQHQPVKLKHFGKFDVRFRKGWRGRHPVTHLRTAVKERYFVSFSPGKKLKEKLSNPNNGQ
jgi:nucleoid DNA-binding protein